MLRLARLSALAATLALVAGCDTSTDPPDDTFSLTVEVQTADGRPAAGVGVRLRYEPADAAAPPTAARGGGVSMSAPYPTPWYRDATVQYQLPTAVPSARIEWYDAAGVLVRTTGGLPAEAGLYQTVLRAENEAGVRLPGGLYRLVGVFGTETVEHWTVLTDGDENGRGEGEAGWTRWLGQTGTDGTVRTDDPSAAPALFSPPAIEIADEQGTLLGQIRAPDAVTVEVVDESGERLAGTSAALADGPNRVTVRL